MARPRRAVFERLSWDGGQMTLIPTSAPASIDADDEAAQALRALAGFVCDYCHKQLTASRGYVCCSAPYCPLCGKRLTDWQNPCPHYLFTRDEEGWGILCHRAWASLHGPNAPTPNWKPTPPARRLPGQKLTGYPAWRAEQLDAAYAPDVRPHLITVFGPILRYFSPQRFAPLLFQATQPDLRTALRDYSRHYREFYFATDPQAALERARVFLTHFHEGTEQLRKMDPHQTVRPAKPAQAVPPENVESAA